MSFEQADPPATGRLGIAAMQPAQSLRSTHLTL